MQNNFTKLRTRTPLSSNAMHRLKFKYFKFNNTFAKHFPVSFEVLNNFKDVKRGQLTKKSPNSSSISTSGKQPLNKTDFSLQQLIEKDNRQFKFVKKFYTLTFYVKKII